MAHSHICRYCLESFICGEDAAECFRKYIVCGECFWSVEFKHFVLFFILAAVAVAATLFVFGEFR